MSWIRLNTKGLGIVVAVASTATSISCSSGIASDATSKDNEEYSRLVKLAEEHMEAGNYSKAIQSLQRQYYCLQVQTKERKNGNC